MYDVCIIGAGVVGASIARELSKYKLKICLLDQEEDVATGASKANSGIVHGGYSAKLGTLKGELCGKGNKMYRQLEKELNFGFRETGALVIGFGEQDKKQIEELYENGRKLGYNDLEIIDGQRIKELEPHISDKASVALHCKSVGVTSPYELTIALAENAIANGVELKLETQVTGIEKLDDSFCIRTSNGEYETRYIINAAGIYSDSIANMLGIGHFEICPRKGQYILLGKNQGHLVNQVIFQVPSERGKGILVTTTYHGNFMIGPNAEEISEKDDIATTMESLEEIVETARRSIPDFNIKDALTTFSGIRAISSTGDFIIEQSQVDGFINVAGIDSPGLTSAPAIAEKVRGLLASAGLIMVKEESFQPCRRGIVISKGKDFDGKIDHQDPNKNIICRCEKVTEAEIVDAIHREIPIKTTDAIKRRTRAGMGPCQGNFCRERVKSIIARELNVSLDRITVRGQLKTEPLRVDIKMIRECKK